MRPKGYKCSNVKCDSCVGHSMCGELGDAAMNCVDRIITRQTNADRIRVMSDEDLAALISRSSIHDLCDIVCGGDCNAVATFNKTSEQRCAEIVLDWLQQSAEEEQ